MSVCKNFEAYTSITQKGPTNTSVFQTNHLIISDFITVDLFADDPE